MSNLKVVVGLGNPGLSYQYTRHNVGALLVQDFAQKYHFPDFKLEKKFQALCSRGQWQTQQLLLVLPQTFMNLSGESVQKILKFYNLEPQENLLAIYDDLDLAFGSYKATKSAPHGHNGVLSLKQQLGTLDFAQIRIGIDDRAGSRQIPAVDYVLQNFSIEQKNTLANEVFPQVTEELKLWLSKN